MPRKQHKYHFIYKTTCLLNENYYIGMHSTSDLEDGYLGSGKRLNYSIKKHGKENFNREILEYFENREELKKREAELVNDNLIQDPLCMNLQHGGGGGFSGNEHMIRCSLAGNKAFKHRLNTDREFYQKYKNLGASNWKTAHLNGNMMYNKFEGKSHSIKTKNQMSLAHQNNKDQQGSKNSQYGTIWITNEKENKKIHKETSLPFGWRLGRNMKIYSASVVGN